MRKTKKGTKGQVTQYISRSQALRKLQLSLADFRRLCILKGIYPREPRNKKKVNKGNSQPKTYYWVKDIMFLAHEPLLKKFREFKAFTKKLKRAINKKEPETVDALKENRPMYTLDHIVRERYPTFVDAIRDLDDALCMIALFVHVPSTGPFRQPVLERCARLYAEFRLIIAKTRSLRKVFLSVKGIYYQAELYGQPVTWIEPYEFKLKVPTNVDLKIMANFLEFYETLLGFVNFKLYHDQNLAYPPKLDFSKDEKAVGLSAYSFQDLDQSTASMITDALHRLEDSTKSRPMPPLQRISQAMRRKIERQAAVAAKKAADEFEDEAEDEEEDEKIRADMDEFPENTANLDSLDPSEVALNEIKEKEKESINFGKLFEGLVIYINRECPKDSIEFVVKCFGGEVGWAIGDGTPFDENDERITHQIVDRPSLAKRNISRVYVQPQWIYDSVNARRLLPTQSYAVGTKLPPHLSPFVYVGEDYYIPEESHTIFGEEAGGKIDDDDSVDDAFESNEEGNDEDEDDSNEIDDGADEDNDEAEEKAERKQKKLQKTQDAEDTKLAAIMMPKKDRELYNRIQRSKQKHQEKKRRLQEKKRKLAQATTNTSSSGQQTKKRKV